MYTCIHETNTCRTIYVLGQYLKHNTCIVLQYMYCVYLALEESACSLANVVLFQFEILLSGKLKECVFCLSVTSWLPKTFFRMKNSKSSMRNLQRNVGSMKDYGKLKTNPMLKCSDVSLSRMKWVLVILAKPNWDRLRVQVLVLSDVYHYHIPCS